MLCGHAPFFDDEYMTKYEKILVAHVEWPDHAVNSMAKDLVKRLLVVDPRKRLGNMQVGNASSLNSDVTVPVTSILKTLF